PDEDRIPYGAVILDLKDGQLKVIRSRATILATGGYQELWAFNDAAVTACGDGLILAYEAGARLVDLEMVQFYPTVVIHPSAIKGTLFQYELVIHPEFLGGRLVNGRGETFIEGMPLRDALSRAIWNEVQMNRGTEHGGVFIDLTTSSKPREALTAALEKWQPNQFHYLKDMGCDLREVRVEVGPHMHFALGGVHIDEKAQTTVPGLFACGEVAGNLHGANRVSGNALSETQVFGARAGSAASIFARERNTPIISDLPAHREKAQQVLNRFQRPSPSPLRPFQIRQALQKIMWSRAGIERNATGLQQGIAEITDLEKHLFPRLSVACPLSYPQERVEALEVKMMILLGRLVLTSAAGRRETRGNHIRTDFPEPSPTVRHRVLEKDQELHEKAVIREDPSRWAR
ncbi:MAG: FAD-binding protein, partial [Deltaproteobacteria bacterium]|nr:FAD-binding protein [Deltaproteobacteria bacterium]